MSKHKRRRISRRTFLISAGTATVAVGTGLTAFAMQSENPFAGEAINAFVALLPDGTVEVVCPAQNLGQGAPTALAMIVAEEMGAALDKVRILQAPRDAGRYGNPDFTGRMVTADSKTTVGYWPLLRLAGAEARKAMIATAALSRGWDASQCKTEVHHVTHTPSREHMSFAEIAALGHLTMPGADADDLKAADTFSLVGTSPAALDAHDIVTGRKKFGTDLRDAETLIAVLRRSPHLGGTVVDLDDAAARKQAGVVDVIALEDASAVAVIASDTWSALKGVKLLEVTWSAAPQFDSTTEKAALKQALGVPGDATVDLRSRGDEPLEASYSASFYAPCLKHVLPEPLNATAEPQDMGLGVRISGSTQSQDLDMRYGAQTWKTAPFMVSCMGHPSGGAYGRRVLNDAVRDAAELAKVLGQPVQVIRPLGDEMKRGQVRPAALQRVKATLDPDGGLKHWQHDLASDGALASHLPSSLKGANADEDNTATDGARHPYDSVTERIRWTRVASLPSPGFLRGVSAAYTVWAVETSVERMARAAGLDPLDWRLRSTSDKRLVRVIEHVGKISGWGDPARQLGLGAMEFRGARIATVAEVLDGAPVALWIAADVGQIVHRNQVLGQIEGGAIWGLSMALYEELAFAEGAAQIDSLADYPILMNGDLPPIHVELIEAAGHAPTGAGEIGVPTVIPALCNALEVATGHRFDALPLIA
ncbi:MAG: xanthine dehydrogenase family protein molybdopterin-binding subunit [Rhodobacteraceae bacterium]|nr:xanthine dehydrogenase family protein molybdopterin-binding subunit [Paracoccaceae bacterium]